MNSQHLLSLCSVLLLVGRVNAFLTAGAVGGSGRGTTAPHGQGRRGLRMSAAPEKAQPPCGLDLDTLCTKLKMEVTDLDSATMGIDSRDPDYGVEIIKTQLMAKEGESLGLILVEAAQGNDGRGLVLIDGCAEGSPAEKSGAFLPGDFLTFCGIEPPAGAMTRVEGFDFDQTVKCLMECDRVQVEAGEGVNMQGLTIVSKRLVKRQPVAVTFEMPNMAEQKSADGRTTKWSESSTIEMLSGSNLRKEMIRREVPVYDESTRRFDQPYATGNCGGESTCGTCFVEVLEGEEHLTPPDRLEQMLLKGFPRRWRLSCVAIVGKDNAPDAKVRLRAQPQSAYQAEKKRRNSELVR